MQDFQKCGFIYKEIPKYDSMSNYLIKTLPLLALLICSCTGDGDLTDYAPVAPPEICPGVDILTVPVAPPSEAYAPLSVISESSVKGTNSFAFNLYLKSSAENKENLCISPFSIENVLGMLANGDDGESRDEILNVLGFEKGETGLSSMNEFYRTLLSNLPNIDDTSCIFTNSLWCNPDIPIFPDFSNKIAKYFYAVNWPISPAGDSGMEAINKFVKTNTYGLIENFLEFPISSSVVFLNTAYFKGAWSNYFSELKNKRVFLNSDSSKSDVKYINSDLKCESSVTESGYEAVRLPYGKRGNFTMTLMMPPMAENCPPLNPDEVFDAEIFQDIEQNFKNEDIYLYLPKFEVATKDNNMMSVLNEMGLNKLCDSNQGLTSIVDYPQPFYLNLFIHATKLIVDEAGTEGAAASAGGLVTSTGNGGGISRRTVDFNRPFAFLIKENTTGAILFIGSVKNL